MFWLLLRDWFDGDTLGVIGQDIFDKFDARGPDYVPALNHAELALCYDL